MPFCFSFEKYPIAEIATICGVHRNTVSRWVERWKTLAIDGLRDVEQEGRPFGRTSQERGNSPGEFAFWAVATVAAQGNGQDRQFLDAQKADKKKDLIWKRIKLGMWKRTAEAEKEFARQDLRQLKHIRVM